MCDMIDLKNNRLLVRHTKNGSCLATCCFVLGFFFLPFRYYCLLFLFSVVPKRELLWSFSHQPVASPTHPWIFEPCIVEKSSPKQRAVTSGYRNCGYEKNQTPTSPPVPGGIIMPTQQIVLPRIVIVRHCYKQYNTDLIHSFIYSKRN